ncbi:MULTISPECIES: DJ-1/PfpI family protein [Streptomyces]|uniref:DJ-1/PfpI family protein n=1 Tax=Streptomyces TaxID=1883 RepID=UPI00069AD1F6|nr:DJ-1/PfpI family protein [Streptomyces kasugaensis]MYU52418.1 DJ-1/PfpI family protein [Streptomyces sp. SID7805]
MRRRDILRSAPAVAVAGAFGTAGSAAAAARPAPGAGATGGAGGPRRGPLRVQVLLFDGVEEQDFIGPYEVFSGAKRFGGAVETRYVTLDGPRTVTAVYGTRIAVGHGWSPGAADILVVPGGGGDGKGGPGVLREIRRGTLPRALAAARRPGLTLAGVCTGALLLSAAGLTRGRPCTTHHKVKDTLRAQGALLRDARVVDDGDLVTSGGITSGIDLALWMVQRELGADLAVEMEETLEHERRGSVWRREPGARLVS